MIGSNNPTILLFNEQVSDTMPTKNWLETIGCHVRETDSIQDAADLLTDFTSDCRPSLVLMNTTQAVTNGADSMQLLSCLGGDVPIFDLAAQGGKNLESLKPVIAGLLSASYARAA